MGEAAEDILEGYCCQYCGEYFHDDDAPGHPRSCGCDGEDLPGSASPQMSEIKREGKRRRQRNKRKRIAARKQKILKNFDKTGWTQLSPTHFRQVINGVMLDYWPSTGKHMEGIHVGKGDIQAIIEKLQGVRS